jgi:hypothetical protein
VIWSPAAIANLAMRPGTAIEGRGQEGFTRETMGKLLI